MFRTARIKLKKRWASITLLSAELFIVAAAYFTALFVFSYAVKYIFIDKDDRFDKAVSAAVNAYVSPRQTSMMQLLSFFASHNFLIPANLLLAAYFFIVRKHKWYSIKVTAIALSSTLLMFGLKMYFGRSRPIDPLMEPASGLSFPSGHAMMSFAFYGLLIYLAHKFIKNNLIRWPLITMLLCFAILIGISRVYLRVHYASDVVAGFAVGTVWLISSVHILNRIEKLGSKKIAVESVPPTHTPT